MVIPESQRFMYSSWLFFSRSLKRPNSCWNTAYFAPPPRRRRTGSSLVFFAYICFPRSPFASTFTLLRQNYMSARCRLTEGLTDVFCAQPQTTTTTAKSPECSSSIKRDTLNIWLCFIATDLSFRTRIVLGEQEQLSYWGISPSNKISQVSAQSKVSCLCQADQDPAWVEEQSKGHVRLEQKLNAPAAIEG